MKYGILLILSLAFLLPAFAAEEKSIPESSAKNEEVKEAERPAPTSLDEAHSELDRLFPPDELAKIDAMKSEKEMVRYIGLGMAIRNDWGLWKRGPLAKHMNELGFSHPDDISGVILETFWCKRHNKAFRLEERAAYYKAWWDGVKAPPGRAKDPRDGSVIDWKSYGNEGDDKVVRVIHLGRSKKTGRWIAFEHAKGVYIPVDTGILKWIKEVEIVLKEAGEL